MSRMNDAEQKAWDNEVWLARFNEDTGARTVKNIAILAAHREIVAWREFQEWLRDGATEIIPLKDGTWGIHRETGEGTMHLKVADLFNAAKVGE